MDQRLMDDAYRKLNSWLEAATTAYMEGVPMGMTADPALAELERIYALESPEGL